MAFVKCDDLELFLLLVIFSVCTLGFFCFSFLVGKHISCSIQTCLYNSRNFL